MKLRKPCEHGRYDEHVGWDDHHAMLVTCPGGEFLADDAPHCEHCYEVGYKDGEANVIADHTQEVTG